MNKEQYLTVLHRHFIRNEQKKKEVIYKTKLYKSLNKQRKTLSDKIVVIDKKINDMVPPVDWTVLTKVKADFQDEWLEMSLIIDVKKRKEAKEKLLKKYKLYR